MTQYQSLYRKWRPKSFEDVVGQNHITRTLKNAIKLKRIAHSYLFSGPRGVGKTTTARILAKALNCQNGPTENPCNRCTCCTRIDGGQSMDVLEIDGASNRGIDEIRELRSKIGFVPTEGKYKIYIIDEVHMLTNEAFNALLKTLEEPPAQVIFIFATTAPHKVPKTILSRCQVFNFRRISIEETVEKLTRITEEEKIEIDAPSLHLIAESATGSMRDAESTLDQVIAYSEEKITSDVVRDILGLIPHEIFRQLIAAIINKDTGTGLKLIDKFVREGVELGQLVEDLLIYTHNLSLLKILGKDNSSSLSYFEKTEWEEVEELAKKSSTTAILKIIEELRGIAERIRFHHYPWVLLELMVVRLAHSGEKGTRLTEDGDIRSESKIDKKDIVAEKRGKLKTPPKKDQESSPAKVKITADDKTPEKDNFEQLWSKVLARIRKEKISLYAFLMAGQNVHIEDGELVIGFPKKFLFHKESLEKKENKKKVEEIFKEEASYGIRLKCVISDNESDEALNLDLYEDKDRIKDNHTATAETLKPEEGNKVNSEEIIHRNNIFKKAHDLFGGEFSEE
ncbi:MAG: DNA polymerase III subunit gamma/tau [Candidatus Atribacteria bacterium]|nr:DNA polymerase III subunit gamma/tau [Candidatus Atribacteria bacterium]